MTPEGEPAELVYVQAKSRKLRALNLLMDRDDDLTCGYHHRGGPGVYLEELDYLKSSVDRVHWETQQTIPAGSYYILVDIEKNSYTTDPNDEIIEGFVDLARGKKVVIETLDPRDSNKRLQFRFWSHDDDARISFEKVNNQMVKIAIAATGL